MDHNHSNKPLSESSPGIKQYLIKNQSTQCLKETFHLTGHLYFADISLLTRAGCRLQNVIYVGLREISSEDQPITDRQVF